MKTVNVLIKGKVQGVFFRASAKEIAENLNLAGWVRNTDAGHVEAMVSGDDDAVKVFTEWCHKGPSRARVSEVIVTPMAEQLFDGFTVKR